MGKFGCRLYCWGCGGCCVITGAIMGVLSALIPSSMMASIQESAFDLAFIDDTSQTESEGLFADAGAPIAESDAFKAWGKTFSEGLSDCLKADFAFDWSKTPEDCVDGLHPTFSLYNATNTDSWGATNLLDVQEVGFLAVLKDTQKVETDVSYWDQAGKARFRIIDTYSNSNKCNGICSEFSSQNMILTVNVWYGIISGIGLGDGWTIAHAVAASSGERSTLDDYLQATAGIPMEVHSALPLPTRTFARIVDFTTFLFTPNAAKLGNINLANLEYTGLRQFLWEKGKQFLRDSAPKYGVPEKVSPLLQKTSGDAILGWGAVPYWVDPISGGVWTFNFVAGASGRSASFGSVPSAFIEEKMSSVYYHQGLGYVTQHYEGFSASTTNNHSCAWDPDCAPQCYPTDICDPLPAAGFDGGKIPGTYFGSPKGQAGFPQFKNFILTYYLELTLTSSGRVVVPAKYRDVSRLDDTWDFEGFFAYTSFKASSWLRRLENCNYPGGRVTASGGKDSPGIDCNFVKDTSPIGPFFGLPLYWSVMIRDFVPTGWDPVLTNAEDGAGSSTLQSQLRRTACKANMFCTDEVAGSKGPGYSTVLSYGYEPNLGALVDVSFTAGVSWKLAITAMHQDLAGNKFLPILWFCNYLHLPDAINMDLSKLQVIPAALNGFYIFLLGQCMISLIGGVTCCFCGV